MQLKEFDAIKRLMHHHKVCEAELPIGRNCRHLNRGYLPNCTAVATVLEFSNSAIKQRQMSVHFDHFISV